MGTVVLLATAGRLNAGDDDQGSSLLGRIFRLGGGSSTNGATGQRGSQSSRLPYGGSQGSALPPGGSSFGSYGDALPPGGSSVGSSAPFSSFGGLPETPALSSSGGPADRLTPRPRVSSAVTTADPVLTRFALGKSNDGSSFGMFLQVFADGTVIDSEGVHHVRQADLKPIVDAVQSGEVYRLRGHCGAASTDFIEYVHLVVYERRFGRLQAHSFSYSGNPQGCDHAVRHLHAAIENLQTKLSRPATPGGMGPGAVAPASPGMVGAPPIASPESSPSPIHPAPSGPAIPGRQPALPSTSPAGPVIPLTPADSTR
jgi:hypothetical protein